jgi:hypothetical protein
MNRIPCFSYDRMSRGRQQWYALMWVNEPRSGLGLCLLGSVATVIRSKTFFSANTILVTFPLDLCAFFYWSAGRPRVSVQVIIRNPQQNGYPALKTALRWLASLQDFAASMPATGGTHCRPPDPRLASLCAGWKKLGKRALCRAQVATQTPTNIPAAVFFPDSERSRLRRVNGEYNLRRNSESRRCTSMVALMNTGPLLLGGGAGRLSALPDRTQLPQPLRPSRAA